MRKATCSKLNIKMKNKTFLDFWDNNIKNIMVTFIVKIFFIYFEQKIDWNHIKKYGKIMSIQFKKIITKYIPGEKVYGIDLVIYKNIEAAKKYILV